MTRRCAGVMAGAVGAEDMAAAPSILSPTSSPIATRLLPSSSAVIAWPSVKPRVDQGALAQPLDQFDPRRRRRLARRRPRGPPRAAARAAAPSAGSPRARHRASRLRDPSPSFSRANSPSPVDQFGRRQRHRRRADELRDEAVGRPVVNLHRRADLLDRAVVHHDDAVGQRHRLGLVVGDHDDRRLDPLAQLRQLDPRPHAQRRVEVGQGLVEQEHLGPLDDRAADRDALALPARQLSGLAVEQCARSRATRAASAIRLSISSFGTRALRSPNAILSRTVMCG